MWQHLSKSLNGGKREAQKVLRMKDEWWGPVSILADSNSCDKIWLWSQTHFTYLFFVRNCQKIQQARIDDSPFILADGGVSVLTAVQLQQTEIRPVWGIIIWEQNGPEPWTLVSVFKHDRVPYVQASLDGWLPEMVMWLLSRRNEWCTLELDWQCKPDIDVYRAVQWRK